MVPRVRALEASPAQRLQHKLGLSLHCVAALAQAMSIVAWWLPRQMAGQSSAQVAAQIAHQGNSLPGWGLLGLLLCTIQVAVLFSLWSVVDWSSLRIISFISLMVGMIYAFLFAVGLLAPRGRIMAALELADLSPTLVRTACLILLLLHGSLAWWAARSCSKWQQQVRKVWG